MINNIRLGYPGENLTTGLRTNRTYLLNKRTPQELIPKCIKAANKNLRDLLKILEWNESQGIRFYRINSSLFPIGDFLKAKVKKKIIFLILNHLLMI